MTTETTRPAVLLRNYYERSLAVDDVTGEARIPIRVRRFSPDQLLEFQRGWAVCENPPSERVIYRKADEAEKEAGPLPGMTVYVIPDGEIRRRRLVEMTPDERAAYEQADEADVKAIAAFCREQIAAHVWVAPGVALSIEDEQGDARAVKTGADLVAVFAGNLDMLMTLTRAIYEENTLSPEKKRILRARFASSSSSTPPPPTSGDAPADPAVPAAPKASVSPAAASALSDPIPSSVTA